MAIQRQLCLVEAATPVTAGDRERLDALRLARSRNVGPRTWSHLIRRFGSASAAVEALPELAARGGASGYRPADADAVAREWDRGAEIGARLVVLGEPGYPRLLGTIDTAPAVLWILGAGEVFDRPAIAMVGSRNASALGLRVARQIAAALGGAGRVVVSGLARGIDTAAHESALSHGTVAVMPGGLDVAYPPENAALAARIAAEGGALVSECPLGVEPTSRHFPRRNRLISGLSLGVLLVEAAARSGSLITARAALDQGREVMAVPGSPEDPRAAGCNALIRDGAALVRDAEDVLEALSVPGLGGMAEPGTDFLFDGGLFGVAEEDDYAALEDFDPDGHETDKALAEQVVALLGPSPVEIDEIARACGCAVSDLSLVVLELELAGRVEIGRGGRIALVPADDSTGGRR